MISFTVETDGRLPSGEALGDAIEAVDVATGGAPLYFMVNCAHPTHFDAVVAAGGAWLLTHAAKAIADRPRPYEVMADAVLRQQPAHGTSFPSTHTAVTLAIVIALFRHRESLNPDTFRLLKW